MKPTTSTIAILILLLSTLIFTRFLGNGYDDFRHQHPDERWLVMVVGKLNLFDQLDPDFFAYGALPMYILKAVAQGGETVLNRPIDTYDGLLVWGRGLVSVMDVLTAILVGLIVWQITKHRQSAIMGSLIYSLMFFPIQNSNFFIVDNFVLFFMTLSIWLLFRYLDKPSWWRLLGVAVGLGAVLASKITPVIVLPIFIGLVAIRPWQSKSSRKSENQFRSITQKLRLRLVPTSDNRAKTSSNQSYANSSQIKPRHTVPIESGSASHQGLEMLNLVQHDGKRNSSSQPGSVGSSTVNKLFRSIISVGLLAILILAFTAMFMPYSFIKSTQFINELKAQIAMNSNAYVFPYTLQYINTPAYLYHLKQIFFYGAGPIISLLALAGILITIYSTVRNLAPRLSKPPKNWLNKIRLFVQVAINELTSNWSLIYLLMAVVFFAVIGRSAVKFMRYLLLWYPFLAVMATIDIYWWLGKVNLSWQLKKATLLIILALAALWTTSFLHIYLQPHTRVVASDWMLANIPPGSTIAAEHWDDRLPLSGGENFQYVELPLYEQPDDQNKWRLINANLDQADYIVLASNRLFTPLPKLANCSRTPERCYPLTTEYYEQLFAGQLGFTKVADFTSRPTLPKWLGSLEIVDDNADESFTVYDHPHVIIFRRHAE